MRKALTFNCCALLWVDLEDEIDGLSGSENLENGSVIAL